MLVGYARVSSVEQETALQLDALRRAGVGLVFQEKRSAGSRRPLLEAMLYTLRRGDTVVVYKTDRLARSLADLLRILARIEAAGAVFRSLTEPIETATPAGRMMLQILGAFAEFERGLIRERSMAGQVAAWRRGARFGRPRAMTDEQEAECVSRWEQGESMSDLARAYGCHLSSVKRAVLRVHRPDSPAVARRFPPLAIKKPADAGRSPVRM